MNTKDLDAFDETAAFRAEIMPLLDKAHALCVEHNIPFLAITQYMGGDDPDDNAKTRCGMSILCGMDGRRTAPTLHAMAEYIQNPMGAMPGLLLAAIGHDSTFDDDQGPTAGHA